MADEWFPTQGGRVLLGHHEVALETLKQGAPLRLAGRIQPADTRSRLTSDDRFLTLRVAVAVAPLALRCALGDDVALAAWGFAGDVITGGLSPDLPSRPIPSWVPARFRGSELYQPVRSPKEGAAVLLNWLAEQSARPLIREEWEVNGATVRRKWILDDTRESVGQQSEGLRALATFRQPATRAVRLRP